MKKSVAIFCVVCILFSCNIRNTKNHLGLNVTVSPRFDDSTSIVMLDSVYDFGTVAEGEKVMFNYRFRNTGTHPLVIASAVASCGCTVPEKPEEPVKPGETGIIKVVFNSEGRKGPANKTVRVVSNAYPAFPTLLLKGVVNGAN
ncbi:MAG: DUF1573 domain-containing protein [Ginsengibacter sp.]